MQRRIFLKNSFVTTTGLVLSPVLSKVFARTPGWPSIDISQLEKEFLSPPPSARPWVYWMWMNGNITKKGITLDLETMKNMGIGGVINFNLAVGIPRGPVDYASDNWMEATAFAVKEAQRLGIDMTIHNSPGYSGCGGPWVTPEMSMQQLVWTETRVHSQGTVNITLPKPYAKNNYYRDAFTVAYPSLPVEKSLMKDKLARVMVNGKEIDKNIITDGNPETKIQLEDKNNSLALNDTSGYNITGGTSGNVNDQPKTAADLVLLLEFIEPFEARAISILRKSKIPHDFFDGPGDYPSLIKLESSDDGTIYKLVGTVKLPELKGMDTPAVLSFAVVTAKYYRLVFNGLSWISDVELYNGPRLGDWPGKTGYTYGETNGETPGITAELLIDPSTVLDISGRMDDNGKLNWNTPAGNWTILRIGHTTTGEENVAHPDSGKGLEIDKFRKEAVDFHFDHFLDKFFSKIKPFIGNSFKGIAVNSWEAGKQNWTVNFPAEFKQRKNYDITSWMPAFTGRIMGSIEDTERFLWDVRKTYADLLAENFYGHFAESCHQRGLLFSAEHYGDGNFDSLQAGQHLDIPIAEFWTRYIYGSDVNVKKAASLVHTYGRQVAAAEAYTAMPATSKWTDYPYSLKAEGDYFFTLGINRLVLHTFVHQPYTTGLPGMTMGPFGSHFDRNNTWSSRLASAWTGYIQRAQYVLQQGISVIDACYFSGNKPVSGIPGIYNIMPDGYLVDVIGEDGLMKRLKISGNSIVLPGGMSYKIFIMSPLISIMPSSLEKITQLVSDGMILIVGNKPVASPGRSAPDTLVKQLADELYGDLDGVTETVRSFGKGKIYWGVPLEDVLKEIGVGPDFIYTSQNQDATIHYCHKQIGDSEVYFVTNHKRRKEKVVASFRVSGRVPQIWDAESGKMYESVLYETVAERTNIPFDLEPAGSLFIVFMDSVSKGDQYASLIKDGNIMVTTRPFPIPKTNLYADVQNNFSVTLWAKPDTFAHVGKSMLFHAPSGESVYGSGHACFGLGAGQNGVRAYERGSGNAKVVLEAKQSLEGWTHIAVVYEDGTPTIFINATRAATGQPSKNVVHPGLGTLAASEQFSSYFEGNNTMPELFNTVLSNEKILELYQKGLPLPQLPVTMEITPNADGKLKALIWQNGTYIVKSSNKIKEFGEIKDCSVTNVGGAWRIQFPKGLGAPVEITMPSLFSLHKHQNNSVKHFSGTATYSKTISVLKTDMQTGKKLFLDLGRVEVIASVKLNGKELGVLWKEPYRMDITKAVIVGTNQLQIQVTSLWPNRLIGDEYLPPENEYSLHRFILKLPQWYVNNKPKPGDRVTFSVWKHFEKTDPLLESGLLGPVRLITAVEKII